MIRRLFSIVLLLMVCWSVAIAQSNNSFTPTLPDEPGAVARVNVTVSPEGAAKVSGSGNYRVGSSIKISTSEPERQYEFVCWRNSATGEVVTTEMSFWFNPHYGTTNLVAEYRENPVYPLVVEKFPETATATIVGGGMYQEGAMVAVFAIGTGKYVFSHFVNKRTGEVTVPKNKTMIFTKTNQEDTLVAHFKFAPTLPDEPDMVDISYKVTVLSNLKKGGTVSPEFKNVIEGSKVTVTASPAHDFDFKGWEVNGVIVSTDKKYTFVVEQDIELTAIFFYAPDLPDEPESDEDPIDDPDPEPEPDEPEEPSTLRGDANGDGRVNILDVTIIGQYIITRNMDNLFYNNADVNGDGRVNATDEAMILNYILNKTW